MVLGETYGNITALAHPLVTHEAILMTGKYKPVLRPAVDRFPSCVLGRSSGTLSYVALAFLRYNFPKIFFDDFRLSLSLSE